MIAPGATAQTCFEGMAPPPRRPRYVPSPEKNPLTHGKGKPSPRSALKRAPIPLDFPPEVVAEIAGPFLAPYDPNGAPWERVLPKTRVSQALEKLTLDTGARAALNLIHPSADSHTCETHWHSYRQVGGSCRNPRTGAPMTRNTGIARIARGEALDVIGVRTRRGDRWGGNQTNILREKIPDVLHGLLHATRDLVHAGLELLPRLLRSIWPAPPTPPPAPGPTAPAAPRAPSTPPPPEPPPAPSPVPAPSMAIGRLPPLELPTPGEIIRRPNPPVSAVQPLGSWRPGGELAEQERARRPMFDPGILERAVHELLLAKHGAFPGLVLEDVARELASTLRDWKEEGGSGASFPQALNRVWEGTQRAPGVEPGKRFAALIACALSPSTRGQSKPVRDLVKRAHAGDLEPLLPPPRAGP